jgi:hypothetical protein
VTHARPWSVSRRTATALASSCGGEGCMVRAGREQPPVVGGG